MAVIGRFGTGPFGTSTYGGISGSAFRLLEASSVNAYTVVLTFNLPLNFAYGGTLDPASYSIPGLTVTKVRPNPVNPFTVVVYTSVQDYQLYGVTVGDARSIEGALPDPLYRTAFFTGYSPTPCFNAVAVAPRRVRLVFVRQMTRDAALLDTNSYTVQNVVGAYNAVVSVAPEQPGVVTSLILTLANDISTTTWDDVRVVGEVTTTGGLSLIPPTATFQWVQERPTVTIGLDEFTGEVQGGLFGNPLGQVFFSPALEAPIANSVIDVDEVDVCTVAYDSYELPQPIDPAPLYTWKAGTPLTTLGQSVLWGKFPRLSDAQVNVALMPSDTVGLAVDGPCTATFQEPWDQDYVSLLNNTHWELHTPSTPGSVVFRTADNLAPIPPGPTITVVLQP